MKKRIKILLMTTMLSSTLNNLTYASEEQISNNEANETIEIKQNQVTEEQYLENVSNFRKLNIEEVYSKFNSPEEFTLYLGRKTCPHCREFSPVLKEFNKLLDNKLNYYDIESPDLDIKAEEFFGKLEIPGVPAVMYIRNGNVVNGWAGGGITAQGLYDSFFPKIEEPQTENTIVEKLDNYIIENKQQSSNVFEEKKKEDIKTIEEKVVKVTQTSKSVVENRKDELNIKNNRNIYVENNSLDQRAKNEKQHNSTKKLPKTSCVR